MIPPASLDDKRYFTLLIALSVIIIFYNLWGGSLYSWDEASYGEIAREITVEGKGWLTLYYNYQPFFEKPPLYMWLTAIAYKLFGINEFAVRIWSALFGFGTVILLYFFTKELFTSRRIALFASFVLLGFYHFVKFSRMGMLDVPLTFFITLALFFFWKGRKKEHLLLLVGVCTGVAFMIKSAAAFQILIIITVFALAAKEMKILIRPRLIYGFLLGFIICVPWAVYEYIEYGMSFINEYVFRAVFQRTLNTLDTHQGDLLYYFRVIVSDNNPLGLISLFVTPYILVVSLLRKDNISREAFILITVSITVILALFSTAKTKLPTYIIPMYPFLSVAIAICLDSVIHKFSRHAKIITMAVVAVLIVITFIRFGTDRKYRSLDYSSELKQISLSAKGNSGKREKLFVYEILKTPVISFYSEREIRTVSKDELLERVTSQDPFICMVSKEDGVFRELNGGENRLAVLEETNKYILYKRR